MKTLCEKCKFYSEEIKHTNEVYGPGWDYKAKICNAFSQVIYVSGNLSECNFFKEKNLTIKEKNVIINQGDKSGSKKKKQKKK